MNFDFYFKRTSFRTMTVFFKNAYKPFFEKWKNQKKQDKEIENSLIEFTQSTFKGLLETLSKEAQFEFIDLLKLLVFSHRHNKNDPYLRECLTDFSIVREPMYKYSRQAQEKFFSYPTYAFLFAWFSQQPNAQEFCSQKFSENQDDRYPQRMTQEILQLG